MAHKINSRSLRHLRAMMPVSSAILLSTLLIASMLCSSCAPKIQSTLRVPRVEASAKAPLPRERQGSMIFIDQLVDARPNEAIAVHDGRDITPDGSVSSAVMKALRDGLRQRGFQFVDTAPVIISGEIRNWVAEIENGGFRAKARADASLYLEVVDPANKRIYSGVYHGYSNIEKTGIDEKDIRKVLSAAMSEALDQVLADPQFMRLISAF